MKIYKCKTCGKVFEVKNGDEIVCPVCLQKGDNIESLVSKYVGTKLKKILKQLLQVKVKQETNIHILLLKQRKKVMSRLLLCFLRQLTMKKNMLKCGLKN